MFGKLENGTLINMPLSGVDKNGCLYVVDGDSLEYATSNGYKTIIQEEPSNCDQNPIFTEDETTIYVNWE